MGVPTLCSPNPDMARFASAGAVIVDDGDWYGALLRLREASHYQALTANLRDKVLALANVSAHGEHLLEIMAAARHRQS